MSLIKNYGESKRNGFTSMVSTNRNEKPVMGFSLQFGGRTLYTSMSELTAQQITETIPGFLNIEKGPMPSDARIISNLFDIDFLNDHATDFDCILNAISRSGFRSHELGDKFLHVSIDKSYFDGIEDDELVNKTTRLLKNFQAPIERFSRSSSFILPWQWMSNAQLADFKNSIHYTTNAAISFVNSDRVEFRLWRGTLKPSTFRSLLKLTVRIASLIKNTNIDDIDSLIISDLIDINDEEIIDYARSRSIVI